MVAFGHDCADAMGTIDCALQKTVAKPPAQGNALMLRLSNRVRLGAALVFGCSTSALAQSVATPGNVSENVVVTASHLAGGTSARDPNVTVLDAAQIAARQPVSITALLGDLPGVYMQQAGGRGSVVSLFARGAQPNFTLVLLDGVKANDPTNTRGGSYDFSTLSLHDIERVEMVQGPASAIYGSDALGGVINIITRKGTPDLQAGLSAEGGGFGYWRAGGHVSGPVGGARANLGLAFEDSGMPVAGGNVRGLSLDGALALPQIAGTKISFNGRFGSSTATSFPDSSGGPRLAVLRALDHRDTDEGVLGAHAVRAMAANWDMLLDYGLYTRSSDTRSPGVAPSAQTPFGIPANTDKARFTRNQLTWTNRFQLDGKLDIAAGLDLQIEHGVDDGTLDFGFPLPTHFALDRTLWAAFAETRLALTDQFTLSASGRYDNNGGDGHFSPHLRADYALADTGTRFQVSWDSINRSPPGRRHVRACLSAAIGSGRCSSTWNIVTTDAWPACWCAASDSVAYTSSLKRSPATDLAHGLTSTPQTSNPALRASTSV